MCIRDSTSSYTYLRKYSKTWPVLEDILEGAHLHAEMLEYLIGIFEQKVSTATVREQLDDILDSLVTDFYDEELPLRKEEKVEQFIVDFRGDESRARQNMNVEQTAFETHKDFTQLLTCLLYTSPVCTVKPPHVFQFFLKTWIRPHVIPSYCFLWHSQCEDVYKRQLSNHSGGHSSVSGASGSSG